MMLATSIPRPFAILDEGRGDRRLVLRTSQDRSTVLVYDAGNKKMIRQLPREEVETRGLFLCIHAPGDHVVYLHRSLASSGPIQIVSLLGNTHVANYAGPAATGLIIGTSYNDGNHGDVQGYTFRHSPPQDHVYVYIASQLAALVGIHTDALPFARDFLPLRVAFSTPPTTTLGRMREGTDLGARALQVLLADRSSLDWRDSERLVPPIMTQPFVEEDALENP